MAFCEDCGSPLSEGVAFCENCGAAYTFYAKGSAAAEEYLSLDRIELK